MQKIIYTLLTFLFFAPSFGYDRFLIHSTPKCGTHFLEKTIHELTGRQCRTIDISMDKLQDVERHHEIARFHSAYNMREAHSLQNWNYKLVCIYRDPRDAIISLVVYLRTFRGQGTHRDFFDVAPNFDHMSFDQQLYSVMTSQGITKNYFLFYLARMNWHLNPIAYGVKYENLVGHEGGGDDLLQVQEILNIAQHINLPITLEHAQSVASRIYHSSGSVMIEGKEFVHGKVGSWRKFMNQKNKEIFKEKFNEVLIKLGYEKNAKW